MKPTTAVVLCLLSTSACSKCGEGTINPANATVEDLVGVWNAPIPAEQQTQQISRLVIEFLPAPGPDDLPAYAVLQESTLGEHPGLSPSHTGAWSVEDGDVTFAPGSAFGAGTNEILELSESTLVLESSVAGSGQLTYQRVPNGCPDSDEHDGWSPTTRDLMALGLVESRMGYTRVVVDSAGRPHVVAGGGLCETNFDGCEPRGLPTTYWTRTNGCLWHSYSFGLTNAQLGLLIDDHDTMHLIGRTQDGYFHYTADADAAIQGPEAWIAVAPGPLATERDGLGNSPVDPVMDGDGHIWLLQKTVAEVDANTRSLFEFDGTAWKRVGSVEQPVDGQVMLSADDGNLRVLAIEPTARRLDVFDPGDLTTPIRTITLPDEWRGVAQDLAVTGEEIHGATTITTRTDVSGDHSYALGYVYFDGTNWTQTQLGPGRAFELMRRGDDFAVVGETVWWREDGEWRAPGPLFDTSADVLDRPGIGTGSAAFDETNGILHYAGRRWYAWHDGFDEATTTVAITFSGDGGGRVSSTDGRVDCTSSCEVEVPAGLLLELRAEGDATSSVDLFHGDDEATAPLPNGAVSAWASGADPITLEVTFVPGGSAAATELPGMGETLIAARNDGGIVAAGGFWSGFSPEGTMLSPTSGQVAPFLAGLSPGGEVEWFTNLEQGEPTQVSSLDIASDSALIAGYHTSVGTNFGTTLLTGSGYVIASIDPQTGAERWATLLADYQGEYAAALDGGGAIVTGSGETRFLDATGMVVATVQQSVRSSAVASGPIWDASGGISVGWNGTELQAFDQSGLVWSATAAGNLGHVAGDGGGGAWVVSDLLDANNAPTCTVDDGISPLFHFDANGTCVYRGVGARSFRSTAIRADGVSAELDVYENVARVSLYDLGGMQTEIPVWDSDPGGGSHVSWSPDGSRLGFSMLVADGTYTGILGTVRYQ